MKTNSGFTLLEVLLAIALLLTVTIGTIGANSLATRGSTSANARAEGVRLARVGMEAVQSVRAAAFTSMHEGTYHPVATPQGFSLQANSETIGDFQRQIILSKVYRSLSCTESVCEIVEAGGIVDEGSLKAKVQIDWAEAGTPQQVVLESLITYWR